MKVKIKKYDLFHFKPICGVVSCPNIGCLPEIIELDAEPVEPDATREECPECGRIDYCECGKGLKQAPNDHRMPQDKSSDERRGNPRLDLKLPEKLKLEFPLNELGETLCIQELVIKFNQLLDFLALQKEG